MRNGSQLKYTDSSDAKKSKPVTIHRAYSCTFFNQSVFEVVQPSHPKSKLTAVVQLLFNIPSSPKSAVIKQFFGSSLAGQSLPLCKLHKDMPIAVI